MNCVRQSFHLKNRQYCVKKHYDKFKKINFGKVFNIKNRLKKESFTDDLIDDISL